MTPENRRPHTPATKELHPGIVPVEEGGERPHLEDAPSIQDINTGEIPTLLPDHSGKLVLTKEERSSDEFQQKTDALRAYHQERSTVDTAPSHTARNITLGAASLLLAGGAIAGVTALNNQPSNTPPETEPSATGGPIAGETQAPAPTNTVESPLASPTNLGPLETAQPTPSASEVAPGALNEFGITTAEYEEVKKSLTIDASTHKTPEEVTSAFMNVIDTYYAGGHSMETRNAHYDDTTPNGQVGWNAWSNELYTKALKESVLTPSSIERSDSPIPNLQENKSIVNRLWVNSAKAGEKEYKVTTSFTIEDVSSVSENGFTILGTSTKVDNSAEVPSAASDSARIIDKIQSKNVEIMFIKIDNQWRVASYTNVG